VFVDVITVGILTTHTDCGHNYCGHYDSRQKVCK
jgi:hypothetical protein